MLTQIRKRLLESSEKVNSVFHLPISPTFPEEMCKDETQKYGKCTENDKKSEQRNRSDLCNWKIPWNVGRNYFFCPPLSPGITLQKQYKNISACSSNDFVGLTPTLKDKAMSGAQIRQEVLFWRHPFAKDGFYSWNRFMCPYLRWDRPCSVISAAVLCLKMLFPSFGYISPWCIPSGLLWCPPG